MTRARSTPASPTVDVPDKYTSTSGEVLLSGVQALVRTTLDMRRLDATRGLDTGVFISGYQGSPLGGVDREVERASMFLHPAGVVFRRGLNEELAATAVAGTQLLGLLDRRRRDGVTGIWFGKNPGLDRAADAIRHANISGTAPLGGAVAWIGDDPASKSSTVPSSCEPMCRSLFMPLLAPGNIAEVLSFGLHAVAMSRHAGLWTGLKIVADVADSSAVVKVDGLLDSVPDLNRRRSFEPPVLLPPTNLDAELDLMTRRLARACEYAGAAGLNRVTFEPDHPKVAIVAAGLSYQSLRRALADMGIGDERLHGLGVRLIQLGMPWPLDTALIRRLLGGVSTVLVIEDKLAFIEGSIKEALYATDHAPAVVGKYDASGAPLLTARGTILSDDIIRALHRVLPGLADESRVPATRTVRRTLDLLPARTPAFCSGCPHSISTRAEPGQLVGVGIGCHVMVALEDQGKRGQLIGMTQMGGEGAQWLGLESFTDESHFFQNIGDGTFYHSGSLAVRAAVAAGATMTFKLLFNDAVAMTGGQTPEGQQDVPSLTRWLTLEGVRRIVITTAHPKTWRRTRFGRNVSVRHRDDLAHVQRELAAEPGVTVLLHIDRCATEERRLRKRGKIPVPQERIWINERVCEGCGDCGAKSTCLSVQPVDTEFGRKTQIHQSSCNQDTSCLHGDCPSFVKVVPSRKPSAQEIPSSATDLPEPRRRVGDDVLIRMPGIGGTGVVTISAVLQMAAFMQGRYAAALEQIGLAQKGGPVISDLRLATVPVDGQLRAGRRTVDVLIGFDALGAATEANLDSLRSDAIAVVNTAHVPTATMVQAVEVQVPAWQDVRSRLDESTAASENLYIDAGELAERFFADHMQTNMILVGAAYQHGVLPLEEWAIEAAIRHNGAAVKKNLAAIRVGRIAVVMPELIAAPDAPAVEILPEVRQLIADLDLESPLSERVERLAQELVAYQDKAYAQSFCDAVGELDARVSQANVAQGREMTAAYAEGLFKLMSFKDEYEVARLHLDSAERAKLAAAFGSDAKVKIMLHPPLLRALGMKRKIPCGAWALPVLRLLYSMRAIRGTRVDVFGWAKVRRQERALPSEYRRLMGLAVDHLDNDNLPLLLDVAKSPDLIRGYEDIKLSSIEHFRAHTTDLVNHLSSGARVSPGSGSGSSCSGR
ncbi:indolepyruvate ferredoxin oxidoreductase family protein [Kribbella sp. NPDC050124]|uniref:indolepyruvate ferredoxin oxidoreductase family protein n=1 Tax=Kribbella sp. NPDC050124 TaxID=3364114 RepID=UPI0037B347C6